MKTFYIKLLAIRKYTLYNLIWNELYIERTGKQMKKLFCIIVAVATFFTLGGNITFDVCAASETPNISALFSGNWSGTSLPVYDGIADSQTAYIEKNASVGDFKAVLVNPTPENDSKEPISVLHTSVSKLSIPLKNLKYVRYYYYYGEYGMPGHTTYDGRAVLKISASEHNLASDCLIYSMEKLVPNSWNYITFDVEEIIYSHILENGTLPEMYFLPFGETSSCELTEKDKIAFLQVFLLAQDSSIAKTAISKGNLVQKYPIYFVAGRADCEGELQEPIFAFDGETITLPECEFVRNGYKFKGWICSVGSSLFAPGESYVVSKRSFNSSAGITTGRTYFIAEWEKIDETSSYEDTVIANYADYWGGLVKPISQTYQYTYANIEKNYNFDGINTLRLVFNPQDSTAERRITLDGSAWNKLPLDISHYKYLAIPYYYKTDRTNLSFSNPQWTFLVGSTKALNTSVSRTSAKSLKANKWDVMIFEFDFSSNSLSKYLNPESGTTIVNQCHFYPFGTNNNSPDKSDGSAWASNMTYNDELYLGNFIFLSEKPQVAPTVEKSFISGYENNVFKPNEYITNAQAAVVLAKSLGYTATDDNKFKTSYTDILDSSHDWCRTYIAYLENRGVLDGGGKFFPEEYIDKTEFVKNIVRIKSENNQALDYGEVTYGKLGCLTRAEAVNKIYVLLRDISTDIGNEFQMKFSDVNSNQWFYSDVALASNSFVLYTDSNGKIQTLNSLVSKSLDSADNYGVTEKQLSDGDSYIKILDELENNRISEIRATKSEYSVKTGGKIYYLSSSEGASDGGYSENNPLYIDSLNKVSSLSLNSGDAVLFKRGDIFRGSFNAVAGVTYSAYGTGNKPVLTRSPENGSGASKWILDYSDNDGKKIWKYYDESFVDVGAINLMDSSGKNTVAYKEVPSYSQSKYWVRGYKPGQNAAYPDGYEFDYIEQLDNDLEFFHKADSVLTTYSHSSLVSGSDNAPNISLATGPLYLRCDSGNPGAIYADIEFNLRNNCISIGSNNNVTVDNLCIRYFGSHGIGAGNVNNLTVTNCEIGWGGGSIQNYMTSSNYSSPGVVVRFGNGVEIYGGLGNYTIDNCYVYQIYDAGITHQVSAHSNGNYYMENVKYTNNVLTDCIYNIEYFMSKNNTLGSDGTLPLQERFMNHVLFKGNVCRRAGYGWGVQRPDGNAPSNIKGWNHHNLSNDYVIEDNIFDRTVDFKGSGSDNAVATGSSFESSAPYFKNNIFVQAPGRTLLSYGLVTYKCNSDSEETLQKLGGVGNKVYFVTDDKEEYSSKFQWR